MIKFFIGTNFILAQWDEPNILFSCSGISNRSVSLHIQLKILQIWVKYKEQSALTLTLSVYHAL